jgi:glucose-6-phosphate isomerase
MKKCKTILCKNYLLKDAKRAEKFHIQWNDFLIDYSKNNITQETIDLLFELANEVDLKDAISDILLAI